MKWTAIVSEKEFESSVLDSDGEEIAFELTATQAHLMAAAPKMLETLRDELKTIRACLSARMMQTAALKDVAESMASSATKIEAAISAAEGVSHDARRRKTD